MGPAVSFERLSALGVFCFCFWRQDLYLVLINSARLVGQRVLKIVLALPPQMHTTTPGIFTWVLGIKPGSSCMCAAWGDCIFSLQEDYHKLLTKYAEAENTIDQLRLGAKVLAGMG